MTSSAFLFHLFKENEHLVRSLVGYTVVGLKILAPEFVYSEAAFVDVKMDIALIKIRRAGLPYLSFGVESLNFLPRTVADALGVSPVYVETEVDFLEEYSFLKQTGDKYIVNFIISEPTAELLTMQDTMYKKAAGLFANELYDELVNSGILDDENIFCNKMLPDSTRATPRRDKNFLLWSLIPYIAAMSGEKLMDSAISFEEVATIRPDGAHNIAHAAVVPEEMKLPEDYVYMRNWCGPYYNTYAGYTLWKVDTEWSGRRME